VAKAIKNLFSSLRAKRIKKGEVVQPPPKKERKPNKEKPEKPKDLDPKEASKWNYMRLEQMGIGIEFVEKGPSYQAIKLLLARELTVEAVAEKCGFQKWERIYASKGQLGLLWIKGVKEGKIEQRRLNNIRCRRDASLLLSALLEPEKFEKFFLLDLKKALSNAEVQAVALDLRYVCGALPLDVFERCKAAGKKRRDEVVGGIPD